MSEELPKRAAEVNAAEHEQIILWLYALDFAYGENEVLYCAFTDDEYNELSQTFGYQIVEVSADDDGLITVESLHLPDMDEQKTDTYTYNPENRTLALQVSTQPHIQEFIDLEALDSQARDLADHRKRLYDSMREDLRKIGVNNKEIAAVFRAHDAVKEMISAGHNVAFDMTNPDELLHNLRLSEQENEVGMISLFEIFAGSDADFASRLQDYRHISHMAQMFDIRADQLAARVDLLERERTISHVRGNPQDFINLLNIATSLKKDAR